jgi:O-glycosyl hydrolase
MAIINVLPFFISTCGTQTNNYSFDSTVNINYNEYHQEIDGFGGSNAWVWPPKYTDTTEDLIKLLYSKTEGMGFTILRNRIPFRERLAGDENTNLNDNFILLKSDKNYDYTVNADGTKTFNLNWESWDLSNTRNLIKHIMELGKDGPENLVIMSTPWTPPNNRVTRWKEDITGLDNKYNGVIDWSKPEIWGRLKKDKYNDYADLLADYAKNFETRMGAPLAILSVQNEPNWKVEYESAYWSGTDIRDFLKIIGQRFPQKGVVPGKDGLKIMAPEYENFDVNFHAMIKPSLDDPVSERILTHIALHQYNGANDPSTRAGSKIIPGIIESGKRFWQTEVSGTGTNIPKGTGIDNALYYARMIHFDLTFAQTNAFLYWWLWTNSTSDDFPGSLIKVDGDEITAALRLYAMGQFSRFIRPGWYRIDCDTSPGNRLFTSAYRNPKTDEIAIVTVNDSFFLGKITFNLPDASFNKLDAWRTSETEKIKHIGRLKTFPNSVTVEIPAKSITTCYGTVK